MRSSRRSFALALSLAASVHACGSGGGDVLAPTAKAGLTILPYSTPTDTVRARLFVPLVVEYRGADGTPRPNVLIELESLDAVPGVPSPVGPILFVFGQAPDFGYLRKTTGLTDANGRASVPIAFGTKAGKGRIRASVPQLDLADTIEFEARPGTANRILFSTRDTVVTIGSAITITASPGDNWNNPRSEPVSLTLRGGPAASFTNGMLRSTAFGQTVIEATFASMKDSVRVGFVPAGRFALTRRRAYSSDSTRVYLINSDLTRRRMLAGPSTLEWSERTPAWSPTGGRLIVQKGEHTPRLFFVDTTTGDITRAITDSTSIAIERGATYSPDGQWIYFAATLYGYQGAQIWRMRADGTGAELAGQPGGPYGEDWSPSVSPDGTRLVYSTKRLAPYTPTLMTVRIGTADTTGLNLSGENPRWSPDGTNIVYIDQGALALVRPDGTGNRTIGLQRRYGSSYESYPTWSPDGQYVLVSHTAGLQMIHVASGEIVYYPYSTVDFVEVTWRPEQ